MSIPSPCINVCRMDAEQQYCVGCLRSIPEITAWSGADDTERLRILAAVAERRAAGVGAGADEEVAQ